MSTILQVYKNKKQNTNLFVSLKSLSTLNIKKIGKQNGGRISKKKQCSRSIVSPKGRSTGPDWVQGLLEIKLGWSQTLPSPALVSSLTSRGWHHVQTLGCPRSGCFTSGCFGCKVPLSSCTRAFLLHRAQCISSQLYLVEAWELPVTRTSFLPENCLGQGPRPEGI